MIILKEFFENVDFEKKNQQTTNKSGKIIQHAVLTLYSMIVPFDTGANAPFSIIFSKVFKILLESFLNYFQFCLKIENGVMI